MPYLNEPLSPQALPQHGTIPNFITPSFPYDWPTPPTSPDDGDKANFNRVAHKLVALTQFVSPLARPDAYLQLALSPR